MKYPSHPIAAVQTILLGAVLLCAMGLLRREPRSQLSDDRTIAPQGDPPSCDGNAAGQIGERDSDRRRTASACSAGAARSWTNVARRVYQRFSKDRIPLVAAGVAFYGILAIFPAIAALVSIYSWVADPNTIDQHVSDLHGILPDGALDIIGSQVKRLAEKGNGALGLTVVASLLLSLWSSNSGVKAVFDGLDIAYDEQETRSFIQLNLQSLAFTAGALLFMALALTGIVVLPVLLQFFGLDETVWYIASLRWPVLLLITMASLAALFRYGPSREKRKWRWVSWGSAVAAALWLVVSGLFSWFVAHFGSYNATYGSLGAVIGFMTWLWISTMIVLLGAELNAELERATVKGDKGRS